MDVFRAMATQKRILLAELAARVEQDRLQPEDRAYLSVCLRALADGQPAQKVFDTGRKKGTTGKRDAATFRNNGAITCIAALIRPKYQSEADFSPSMPSGEGMLERDAIVMVANMLSIDQDSLERYWNQAKLESPELLSTHVNPRRLYPK
jgi:acyl transferase domain-containing protein